MEPKRLLKSQTNKIIAGVCGGLADYFDVDPVIMRVLFVLLAFFGGTGFILYIACWIIIPKRTVVTEGEGGTVQSRSTSARRLFGVALIVGGAIILFSNLGFFSYFHIWNVSWSFVFPILLILLGMAIIYYRQAERVPAADQPIDVTPNETQSSERHFRTFRRSTVDKKLFGVCGGLANYFSIDVTLLRLLYIILCLASFGAGVVLYITLVLLVPYDRQPNP
ncbi:MAG TPA: PspC domain-containing protein [Bacteroidota bacterium]|nr:PspC domain-containing protein [Bacteroidota bacterium]